MKDAIVGACGVCYSACELHEKVGCSCSADTEERAKEKVETNWDGRVCFARFANAPWSAELLIALVTVRTFPVITSESGTSPTEQLF